jgi:hypothetical protein
MSATYKLLIGVILLLDLSATTKEQENGYIEEVMKALLESIYLLLFMIVLRSIDAVLIHSLLQLVHYQPVNKQFMPFLLFPWKIYITITKIIFHLALL